MDTPSPLGVRRPPTARTRQVVGAKRGACAQPLAGTLARPKPRPPLPCPSPFQIPPPSRGFPESGDGRAVEFTRCWQPVGRWNRRRATTPEKGVEAAPHRGRPAPGLAPQGRPGGPEGEGRLGPAVGGSSAPGRYKCWAGPSAALAVAHRGTDWSPRAC